MIKSVIKQKLLILGLLMAMLIVLAIGCNNQTNTKDNQNEDKVAQQTENVVTYPGIGPNTIAEIVEKASPAVVKIETLVVEEVNNPLLNDPFFRQFFGGNIEPQAKARPGLGSGFIVSKDGYIVTNQHVIDGASKIQVRIKGQDEPIPAEVAGADYDLDLAVLKIKANKDLPTLKLGNSDAIKVGHWVIAIGSPYGLEDTVTVGVISAKERPVDIEDRHYKHLLQTDASINPGNSGGPLFNLNGEVVGINTAVNAQAQGIGFAIPTSTVQEVLDELIEIGRVTRPWMGVQIETVSKELAQYYGLDQDWGVLIGGVVQNSPAQMAGLKPGDIITNIDGKKVTTVDELTDIVESKEVGEKLNVDINRSGQKLQVILKVAERPTTGS
ncbi:trypsin-like peptidase domain-containing protein [Peptococcaceae bacterium 1198_IL3148]